MVRFIICLSILLPVVGVGGCSDDSKVDFSDCELMNFEQTTGIARVTTKSILLKSSDSDAENSQSLLFESWLEAGGPSEPGVIKFDPSINYRTCNACLTLETGCEDGRCDKLYLATAGNLTLQAVSEEEGEPIGIRLNEIRFEQITLDQDYTSTRVEGAPAYCLRDVGISGLIGPSDDTDPKVVEAAESSAGCVPSGSGAGLGHNLKDFALMNCLGETVSLHDSCGVHKAIWMVTTAGWCSACESWIPEVQSQYETMKDNGLELFVYLGADINFEAPTLDYCASYAERKGLDPSKVFVDPNWGTLFDAVDRYDYSYTPMNIVLDGSNMAYVWSDGANDGETTSLSGALQGLFD